MNENKKTKISRVKEVPYGMYVWRCADGEVAGDGEGNIMNVFCLEGNQQAINAITNAAKYYGFPNGRAEWWSGVRPVTDEELAEQEMRAKLGLIPDPMDVPALIDEARANKING